MNQTPKALQILLEFRPKVATSLSVELIERIFSIEERVQFDGNRSDSPDKIRQVVQAELDKEFLEEESYGNASH